jgi:MFS transporter, BCD family, chlorophyll transporter
MKRVLGFLNALRLAGFPLGYGLTGALMGGTLNRVMLAEFNMGPALVGLFFAVPMMVSPLRVWFGYCSDGYTIFGRRREPYIIAGALITGLAVALAVGLAPNAASNNTLLIVALVLAFALYGVGRSLGHNTFQSLVSDRFSGNARPRAMVALEVATLLGLVIGAGGLKVMLGNFSPSRLLAVTLGAMVVMVTLTALAAIGQEQRGEQLEQLSEQASKMPFRRVLREVVLSDPQIRMFFGIIMLTFVGTFAQDVFLEPYGGLVLGMPVDETTALTARWGIGVLIAMLISGMFLVRYLGYLNVLRIGLVLSMVVFVGVIVSGSYGNVLKFETMVLMMGLGTGTAGAGMLAGLITFTTPVRAGLLLGVWGIANLAGQALGAIIGGIIVETMLRITGDAYVSYSAVFVAEVVMLLAAFALTLRFHPEESSVTVEAQEVAPAMAG